MQVLLDAALTSDTPMTSAARSIFYSHKQIDKGRN